MAVYNGGKYLNEQLGSIVNQLTEEDELIISDNMSTDDSRDIILSYAKLYPNIQYYTCNEQGILANFESVISKCNGDYIFLADQDDIWKEDKIEKVLQRFEETDADLILHNCDYVDDFLIKENLTLFKDRDAVIGYKRNLIKNAYQGCCMAFKKELVKWILPIPRNVAMHDQWIGLLAEKVGTVNFMEDCLILYRRHPGNYSSRHVGIVNKIKYMAFMNHEIQHRIQNVQR